VQQGLLHLAMDKILRVEGKNIQVKEIVRTLKSKKCQCEILV
jgi:hypothetical protein